MLQSDRPDIRCVSAAGRHAFVEGESAAVCQSRVWPSCVACSGSNFALAGAETSPSAVSMRLKGLQTRSYSFCFTIASDPLQRTIKSRAIEARHRQLAGQVMNCGLAVIRQAERGRWIVVAIAHRSSRMPAKSPRTTTAALASVEVLLTNVEAASWSASWSCLYPRAKLLAELAPILPVLSKAEKWIMSMLVCLSCERRKVESTVGSTEVFICTGRLEDN